VCGVVWMYVGMIGGAVFIILQLILLVDFAHNWHSRWSVSQMIDFFSHRTVESHL